MVIADPMQVHVSNPDPLAEVTIPDTSLQDKIEVHVNRDN